VSARIKEAQLPGSQLQPAAGKICTRAIVPEFTTLVVALRVQSNPNDSDSKPGFATGVAHLNKSGLFNGIPKQGSRRTKRIIQIQ